MFLSDISVKRPVLAVVMSMMIVGFGALAFLELPVREFPDIEVPVVSINVDYPGASAQVVENRITRLLEDRVAGIEGIKTINSSSQDGRSQVTIEFSMARDIDSAVNDVREKLGRVAGQLPEEARPPEIFKVNFGDRPIIWLNLSSPVLDTMQLTDYADRFLSDRFSVIPGVARIRISGEKRYAMRVWLDRKQLAARQLTVGDVERVLRQENVELPAGRLESESRDFSVRVERAYKTLEDFQALVLGRGADGHLIRLGEVAEIEIAAAEERQDFRGNGLSTVGVAIVKQSTANTLEVAQVARAEVLRIQRTLPESMELVVAWDSSVFIEEAISQVWWTLGIAGVLVMLVIYLFLGSLRAALVPALTVPVSLVGTFMALNMAGFSLNLLTLLALVLSIGLVVDDAIVVLENIYRRVERGEPPLMAAYKGARQVAFAVVATTLVLLGVFVPIIFLEGSTGRIFGELALTLAAAVALSSFVALTLSPMMCSRLLKRETKKSWLNIHLDDWFERLGNLYQAMLRVSFRNKGAVVLMLLASMLMIAGLFQRIAFEFAPNEDRGAFSIRIQGPEGASYPETRKHVLEVEARLLKGVEEGFIRRVLLFLPGWGSAGGNVNNASGFIILEPWQDRDISTQEAVNWARAQMKGITAVRPQIAQMGSGGHRGSGGPVGFVVGGNTYEDLARFREILLEKVQENPGLLNVSIDYKETKPQLKIDVDRTRAADLGVSVSEIGRTLESMLGGRRVTTYVDRGEEYDVIVRASSKDRQRSADISNLYVRSDRTGVLVPLASLVTIREVAYSGSLKRYNRIRALTLSASLAPGYKLGDALDWLEKAALEELPDIASIDYSGESRDLKETGTAVYFTFILALLVVYLILAAQFESFLHPAVIMLTVPLAIVGGLGGLWLLGSTLNIYSMVGLIILIGLAAKNGILIVEFANQLRDLGYEVEEAVLEACKIRLRPIMMTGLSTVFGAVPLVLASGAGSVSRASIGIVIVSGVFFSTVFTLVIVPVFYRMAAPYTTSPGKIAAELKKQQNAESSDSGSSDPLAPAPQQPAE